MIQIQEVIHISLCLATVIQLIIIKLFQISRLKINLQKNIFKIL